MTRNWHRVGHRGAPKEFPANTLRSFQRAVALGATMVECDVRQAAGGVLVLAHDADVTDAQGRTYAVREHDSGFLRHLDLGAGEGVPTLAELVDWAQGKCAVMADMKCEGEGIERLVVETLAPLAPASKLAPGAGEASRARFRALDPAFPLSLSLGSAEKYRLEETEFEAVLDGLDTDDVTWVWPMLTAERIARLHERGIRVYAWTVDDLPTMRQLRSAGVDGIISNRPDLLAQVE
jgi:glycerophosphoryl diester phosphodiesterase